MDAERNWGPLTGGIILMLLGGLFLAVRLGWLSEWPWHSSWWALIVIGMGLAMLIQWASERAIDARSGDTSAPSISARARAFSRFGSKTAAMRTPCALRASA